MSNKYGAIRSYSQLCEREFHSKAEMVRGEELALLERAGEIKRLEYQVKFPLCDKPKITIKIDFAYLSKGKMVYEDVKGYKETREFRVKRMWLKEKFGVDIILTK